MTKRSRNSFLGHRVIKAERKLQSYFLAMLKEAKDPKERSLLRDILLYEEMNELLLRTMYNL